MLPKQPTPFLFQVISENREIGEHVKKSYVLPELVRKADREKTHSRAQIALI